MLGTKLYKNNKSDMANSLIDITQYAQELAHKADRQLSNLDTNNLSVHVVVDSYYDGKTGNWYRIYSDGWIEQGGINNSSNITTLLKPFLNSNYVVQATAEAVKDMYGYDQVVSRTPTKITWCLNHTNTLKVMWYACGMGAE